jgi:uncharacterized protein
MMTRTTREAVMPAQARVHEPPIDRVDLEALDSFLASERSPPESMMLSDLDGFLTGIAVGPELVLPSEWLPQIFGGEAPEFADEVEAKAILGTVMGRYNEILRQIADDGLDPVFWAARDGIAADWAEGFLQAIMLRVDAWGRLFKSKRDGHLLFPILALCGDENGESLLGLAPDEEDRVMEEMTEFIPECVIAIAAYWRGQGTKQVSMPLTGTHPSQANRASLKVGRNNPVRAAPAKSSKSAAAKTAEKHHRTTSVTFTGWIRLLDQPWRIMSIALRDWANGF